MEHVKKLRLPRHELAFVVGGTVILIFLLVNFLGGIRGIALVYFIIAVVNAVQSYRTKNTGNIIITIGFMIASLLYWSRENDIHANRQIEIAFHLCMIGAVIYLIYTRKIKWRFREVFELAARPIKDNEDGFTQRPFPAGKVDYSQNEIQKFTKFIFKHLITVPYYEKDRVVFVLSGNVYLRMLWLKNDYKEDTWVAFCFDGNVLVNIQQKTYSWYKDELTFDQLCASLGHLFVDFYELHKNGKGFVIIDRMNALKENVWTEV